MESSARMDPWYDYLALPVAPLILVAQGLLLLVPQRAVRVMLSLAAAAAIAAMFVYVATLPLSADEGANIGAGVLLLWLLVSLGLLAAAAVRKRRRPSSAPPEGRAVRKHTWAKTAIGSSLVVLLIPSLLLAVVPVAAAVGAWLREPPSRLRLAATGLTALAAAWAALAG